MSESLFDSKKYKLINNKLKTSMIVMCFLEQFFYKKIQKIKPILLVSRLKGSRSSNFGWRIDPFTKIKTFHEGTDFCR